MKRRNFDLAYFFLERKIRKIEKKFSRWLSLGQDIVAEVIELRHEGVLLANWDDKILVRYREEFAAVKSQFSEEDQP